MVRDLPVQVYPVELRGGREGALVLVEALQMLLLLLLLLELLLLLLLLLLLPLNRVGHQRRLRAV